MHASIKVGEVAEGKRRCPCLTTRQQSGKANHVGDHLSGKQVILETMKT